MYKIRNRSIFTTQNADDRQKKTHTIFKSIHFSLLSESKNVIKIIKLYVLDYCN